MKQYIVSVVVALLSVTSTETFATQTVAEIKAVVADQLDRASAETRDFKLKVIGADSQQVTVGRRIGFAFDVQQDCFVTIAWVESGGDTNIIRADQPITPGDSDKVFPTSGAIQITPPLGKDTLYAFCTQQKPELSNFVFNGNFSGIRSEDAKTQIPMLIDDLSRTGHIVASSKIQLSILGRKKVALSAEDIVSYFNRPAPSGISRSILAVSIKFDLNSAQLDHTAADLLNNIGNAFVSSDLARSRFRINGHTDSSGSEDYNEVLSERRAASVRDFLTENFDIDPLRLDLIGWGENMAKSDNSTEDGKAENRRVEFELLK